MGRTQLVNQQCAGTMQARTNCADRTPENLGSFCITHFLQIAEHNHFSITLRQRKHGFSYGLDRFGSRKIVEWSKRFSLYAVSPLLNWSSREIYRYMKQHDLPFHPLYEKGYASIGCNPTSCTRAITIGEDPRAGRWAGTDKIECGLHLEEEGGSGI